MCDLAGQRTTNPENGLELEMEEEPGNINLDNLALTDLFPTDESMYSACLEMLEIINHRTKGSFKIVETTTVENSTRRKRSTSRNNRDDDDQTVKQADKNKIRKTEELDFRQTLSEEEIKRALYGEPVEYSRLTERSSERPAKHKTDKNQQRPNKGQSAKHEETQIQRSETNGESVDYPIVTTRSSERLKIDNIEITQQRPQKGQDTQRPQTYAERAATNTQATASDGRNHQQRRTREVPGIRVLDPPKDHYTSLKTFLLDIDPTGLLIAELQPLRRSKQLLIVPTSLTSHREIESALKTKEIPYNLLRSQEQIPLNVVVTGIPPTYGDDELKADVEAMGFKVQYVHNLKQFKSRPPTPSYSWKIALQKTPQAADIMNITQIGPLMNLKISHYNPPLRPTQCTKCWRVGHIAKSCCYPERCKYCAGSHHYTLCTEKLNLTKRKCVNCGQAHVASNTRCETYQHEHIRRLTKEAALANLRQKIVTKHRESAIYRALIAATDKARQPLPKFLPADKIAKYKQERQETRTRPNIWTKPTQPATQTSGAAALLIKALQDDIKQAKQNNLPYADLVDRIRTLRTWK